MVWSIILYHKDSNLDRKNQPSCPILLSWVGRRVGVQVKQLNSTVEAQIFDKLSYWSNIASNTALDPARRTYAAGIHEGICKGLVLMGYKVCFDHSGAFLEVISVE